MRGYCCAVILYLRCCCLAAFFRRQRRVLLALASISPPLFSRRLPGTLGWRCFLSRRGGAEPLAAVKAPLRVANGRWLGGRATWFAVCGIAPPALRTRCRDALPLHLLRYLALSYSGHIRTAKEHLPRFAAVCCAAHGSDEHQRNAIGRLAFLLPGRRTFCMHCWRTGSGIGTSRERRNVAESFAAAPRA